MRRSSEIREQLQSPAHVLSDAPMPHLPDLMVFSSNGRQVLVVECRGGGNDTSAEEARCFRRNLSEHDFVPSVPFYMLAYPGALFVWKEGAGADEGPDFQASAETILARYVPSLLPLDHVQRITMELVMHSWLGDLTEGIGMANSESEADQMLVDTGIVGLIRGGTVIPRGEP